jgi:predicted secreted Zn-dependent protease
MESVRLAGHRWEADEREYRTEVTGKRQTGTTHSLGQRRDEIGLLRAIAVKVCSFV